MVAILHTSKRGLITTIKDIEEEEFQDEEENEDDIFEDEENLSEASQEAEGLIDWTNSVENIKIAYPYVTVHPPRIIEFSNGLQVQLGVFYHLVIRPPDYSYNESFFDGAPTEVNVHCQKVTIYNILFPKNYLLSFDSSENPMPWDSFDYWDDISDASSCAVYGSLLGKNIYLPRFALEFSYPTNQKLPSDGNSITILDLDENGF